MREFRGWALIFLALGLILAALIYEPKPARPAEPSRACRPIADVKSKLDAAAKEAGLDVAELYGIEAFRALDYLNNHVGERTNIHADAILAFPLVDAGKVALGFGLGGCALEQTLTVGVKDFADAVRIAKPRKGAM